MPCALSGEACTPLFPAIGAILPWGVGTSPRVVRCLCQLWAVPGYPVQPRCLAPQCLVPHSLSLRAQAL